MVVKHQCATFGLTTKLWVPQNSYGLNLSSIDPAVNLQVAQAAVPLLLHSITLTGGADIFWKSLDEDFNAEDWRVRFAATEKVTLIFRFLEDKPVKRSTALRQVLPGNEAHMYHAHSTVIALAYHQSVQVRAVPCLLLPHCFHG